MNFIDDKDKKRDFRELTKEEFLKSYSYLREGDYEDTKELIQKSEIINSNNKDYLYNVRILNSIDGGKNFYYTGNGKFVRSKEEAESYLKSLKHKKIQKER